MRIINLNSNEAYELKTDTKIEVERTNPFFNDYGEQTTPLELPASEHNRRLLNFPDALARRTKMTPIDVAISDGEYFAQCRQIVHSAQYKGAIATSFYINDGSFYSRIRNVKLKDVFADECIHVSHKSGNTPVQDCIDFCRTLRTNNNPHYAIFPVLLTDDSGTETGLNFKVLNAYGKQLTLETKKVWKWGKDGYEQIEVPALTAFYPDYEDPESDFYNATQRTEYVNQTPITLAPGYYISPFIRANYLLQRVFTFFGYQLQENFFTQTDPFDKMVVLNNVIDTLANGKIKIADLVPDITCADFIAVFRKKFCCEFTADEALRTANVIFLKDTLKTQPEEDLTKNIVEEPTVAYKAEKDYKRITLAPEDKLDTEINDAFDDLANMKKAAPAAYFNPVDGAFYKDGFSGNYTVYTKIGEASQDYNTGEELEPKEIKIPELIPEFRILKHKANVDGAEVSHDFGQYLYIGNYITHNSKMMIAGEDKESTTDNAAKQKTMLAFSYISFNNQPEGTISPYDLRFPIRGRIFDYALYYHGEEGIFEKFYRQYDQLLRNALHETKVKLLLSQTQKQNLPATAKVIIRGVAFLFDKLKFTLGGKNEPVESSLRSIALMEPIINAPTINQLLSFTNTQYKWVGHEKQTEVSREEYENAGPDKERTFNVIYPPTPAPEYVGIPYAKQTSITSQKTRHATLFRHSKWKYTKTEVWLECVPK